jgi:non-heme Fe2+,alpha-ketoglutarate-dependent halogenase
MGALSPEQVRSFRENGYLAPVPVLSPAEVSAERANLDALFRKTNGLADPSARYKPHLYAKWVSDLVRNSRILDAVEDLLGPDLLVWRSIFFFKKARSAGFVDWHQDSRYWRLDSEDVVTAWIALTESTVENGCLRVVPGSHRRPEVPHAIRFSKDNVLVRGQSAAAEVPEDQVRCLELRPGEMSLHHVGMLHGSRANTSDSDRVGLAIRFLSPNVRRAGWRQSATLVRGKDRFGNFTLEPEPRFEGDPVALAWHRRSRRRYAAEIAWEALTRPTPANLEIIARAIAHPRRLFRALRAIWRSDEPSGESRSGSAIKED